VPWTYGGNLERLRIPSNEEMSQTPSSRRPPGEVSPPACKKFSSPPFQNFFFRFFSLLKVSIVHQRTDLNSRDILPSIWLLPSAWPPFPHHRSLFCVGFVLIIAALRRECSERFPRQNVSHQRQSFSLSATFHIADLADVLFDRNPFLGPFPGPPRGCASKGLSSLTCSLQRPVCPKVLLAAATQFPLTPRERQDNSPLPPPSPLLLPVPFRRIRPLLTGTKLEDILGKTSPP